MKIKKLAFTAVTAVIVLASAPVQAQTPAQTPAADGQTLQFAGKIAGACLDHWEAPSCLSAVSESNMALLSNYGAALQNGGYAAEAEQLKQHCAATTAASQETVPAYAMRSALTECANTITDISGKTGVQPDPSHYQLLLAPLLCLSADPRCAPIAEQMKAYVK
jgi:hypothetical protein